MAVISKDISDRVLLGERYNEDVPLERVERYLSMKDDALERRKNGSKVNRKAYYKGVYTITYTCNECGSKFKVNIPTQVYHLIVKYYLSTIKEKKELATIGEVGTLLRDCEGVSKPLWETYSSGRVLCQRCISRDKNIKR